MSENFQVSDLQNRKQKHRFDSMDFNISWMNPIEPQIMLHFETRIGPHWLRHIHKINTNQMLVNRINATGIFQTMV